MRWFMFRVLTVTAALVTLSCGASTSPVPDSGAEDVGGDAALEETRDDLGRDTVHAPDVAANQAPSLVWTEPAEGAVLTLGRKASFAATVTDDDTAPTDLGLSLTVAPGDPGPVVLSAGADGAVVFSLSTLAAGEQTLTLTAYDQHGESRSVTLTVLVDAAPGAAAVRIEPAIPRTTDDLVAVIEQPAVDPELGTLPSDGHLISWRLDGELVDGLTGLVVPAERTKGGETWQVVVQATDGATFGPKATGSVTIDNSPPPAPMITIEPAAPTVASTVTCAVTSPSIDADGEAVTEVVRWTLNGVDLPGAAGALTLSLASKASGAWKPLVPVNAGDVLACLMGGDDGFVVGPAGEASVTLGAFDPCADGAGGCPARTVCQPTGTAAAACPCAAGYDTLQDGYCADVDECAPGKVTCGGSSTCSNTDGGYDCVCDAGWSGNGKESQGCLDADECQEGTAACDPFATCVNTPGSYRCECSAGYEGDGAIWGGCFDLDECGSGLALCGPLGSCANTVGGYDCLCPAGYDSRDDKACLDLDECETGAAVCDEAASCANTEGGYDCTCAPGFTGDGKTCSDVDECLLGLYDCAANAACRNLVGSYDCECSVGFTGDAQDCVDVDECAGGATDCSPDATCINAPGGYACECNSGFLGDGIGVSGCADVDECLTNQAVCGVAAECVNDAGSYECRCGAGYTGDGMLCTDVDECTAGTAVCDAAATCKNLDGTYGCTCKPGWIGDGTTCAPAGQ